MLILYLFSLHRTDLASLKVPSLVLWVSRITRIQMTKYIKLGNAKLPARTCLICSIPSRWSLQRSRSSLVDLWLLVVKAFHKPAMARWSRRDSAAMVRCILRGALEAIEQICHHDTEGMKVCKKAGRRCRSRGKQEKQMGVREHVQSTFSCERRVVSLCTCGIFYVRV